MLGSARRRNAARFREDEMKKRLVFLAIGGLAAGLAMPAIAADSLTVVSWGGAYQDSVRKAFFEPFMKETGDKIVDQEVTWF